jgi:NAD(P)-dependent dehydrogenase (short-subunit alcohol dehydrogenase family)
MGPIQKRVCLLTGASGLLGTQFCEQHAQDFNIAGIYWRNPPRVGTQHTRHLDPLNPETGVSQNGHRIFAIKANLADDAELERVVDLVLARFDRIDVLINGAAHPMWAPLLSNRLMEEAEAQLRMNVLVPMKLSRLVAHRFWKQRVDENRRHNRNVINLSSISGVYVYPDQGQSLYSASKAALNYLTWHMASEFWSMGIRVNAIAPNAFPSHVPTWRVLDKMKVLDSGAETGKIYVLDRDQEVVM